MLHKPEQLHSSLAHFGIDFLRGSIVDLRLLIEATDPGASTLMKRPVSFEGPTFPPPIWWCFPIGNRSIFNALVAKTPAPVSTSLRAPVKSRSHSPKARRDLTNRGEPESAFGHQRSSAARGQPTKHQASRHASPTLTESRTPWIMRKAIDLVAAQAKFTSAMKPAKRSRQSR